MSKFRYGRPKVHRLDLVAIEKWLPSIGFIPEKLTQEWRHVVVFGAYEGKACVLKMASTQTTGRFTRNERNWNDAIHLTDPALRPHLTVPRVYAEGFYGKLYYFICDWYTQPPLARLSAFNKERAQHWLPIVARANREIEELKLPPDCDFVTKRITSRSSKVSVEQKLVLASREWASLVPRGLSDLLGYLESIGSIKLSPAHGDFVLRQMHDLRDKIGLIDGEHAGPQGALHYDVAQMYVRLISDWNEWELAHDYLLLFRELLPKNEHAEFWQDLKPPLIQRYIGDLWGSKNNPANLERLWPLKEMILKDTVI